ncbi:MAG TPA: type II secretion system protein [Pyrinomonadaceae bacterium]
MKKQIRGDAVRLSKPSGRRVTLLPKSCRRSRGFTLIELVITITVLTILTMGVVPLMKLSVKRQKEQQLHEALRQIRSAIDEFHRDTVGINCTGTTANVQPGAAAPVDPRSKVIISDCTIFGVDNPDRFPPDLETLVSGVNVIPRGSAGNVGGQGLQSTGTSSSNTNSVLGSQLSTKKKVYLRSIPIDPMTGKADWCMLSNYDDPTIECTGGQENVFDVHSKSHEKALNGEKYSDW